LRVYAQAPTMEAVRDILDTVQETMLSGVPA